MEANRFEDIYEVVRLIPVGRVTSYGAIAQYLGAKGGARLVGWAMNACHADKHIPAHRVVNREGVLTGKAHFGGDFMEKLLKQEGIEVKDNKIVNFKQLFWSPIEELLH